MQILRYLQLYRLLWLQGIQSQMEYKLNFILGNTTTILGQITGIAFVWVIFHQIGDLNGWTLPEIMLIYGIAALPYGLFELFFNGVWSVGRFVRQGEFDMLLTRPVDSLLFVLGDQTMLHGIGNFGTGFIIVILASQQLGLQWSALNVLVLILMVLCGTVIYISINTITASTNFWFVGTGNTVLYMGQRFRDFTVFPLDIYALSLRILLTWFIPFAFTSFYPATYFLGRTDYTFFVILIPIVTVGFFGIACLVWKAAINRYESTGS